MNHCHYIPCNYSANGKFKMTDRMTLFNLFDSNFKCNKQHILPTQQDYVRS